MLMLLFMISSLFLVGCSQSLAESGSKVTSLQAENKIPSDGVISEKQMKTIENKNKEVRFTKKTEQLSYTWIYHGKQVQNAVKQKLNLSIKTKNLEAVKKLANNASEAMEITSESMELAGTPTIELKLNSNWNVDKTLLVRKHKGKLQLVSDSPVTVKKEDGATILSYPVFESGVTYYLIGGGNQENTTDTSTDGTQSGVKQDQTVASGQNQLAGSDSSTNEVDNSGQTPTETTTEKDNQTEVNGEVASTANNKANSNKDSSEVTATISISCSTILNNRDKLNKSKASFVPSNGIILGASPVEVKSGESVYDLLVRATKQAGIQMEASWTPVYDAYYIEGINQLYEFDCGNLSGWMYKVNGWFPNYGASKYEVQKGDVIEWVYTCDLGRDIGGSNMMNEK